jgi:hypothetical protein
MLAVGTNSVLAQLRASSRSLADVLGAAVQAALQHCPALPLSGHSHSQLLHSTNVLSPLQTAGGSGSDWPARDGVYIRHATVCIMRC